MGLFKQIFNQKPISGQGMQEAIGDQVQPYTAAYYDQQYSPEAIFARKSGKPRPVSNYTGAGYAPSAQATAYENYHKSRNPSRTLI